MRTTSNRAANAWISRRKSSAANRPSPSGQAACSTSRRPGRRRRRAGSTGSRRAPCRRGRPARTRRCTAVGTPTAASTASAKPERTDEMGELDERREQLGLGASCQSRREQVGLADAVSTVEVEAGDDLGRRVPVARNQRRSVGGRRGTASANDVDPATRRGLESARPDPAGRSRTSRPRTRAAARAATISSSGATTGSRRDRAIGTRCSLATERMREPAVRGPRNCGVVTARGRIGSRAVPLPGRAERAERRRPGRALRLPQRGTWVRANFVAQLDGAAQGSGLQVRIDLSGQADQRLFALLRSLCDVILVGAGTARIEGYQPVQTQRGRTRACGRSSDSPRLPSIAVVSRSLDLDPDLLAGGEAPTLVITTETSAAADVLATQVAAVAPVIVAGEVDVDSGRDHRRAHRSRLPADALRRRPAADARPVARRRARRALPDDRTDARRRRPAAHHCPVASSCRLPARCACDTCSRPMASCSPATRKAQRTRWTCP